MFRTLTSLLLCLAAPSLLASALQARIPSRPCCQDQEAQGQEHPKIQEARRLIKLHDMQAAERLLREVAETEPRNGEALYLLAYSLHRLERLKEALEMDLRAAEIEGRHQSFALYNAACASALLGRTEDAFRYLDACHRLGFNNQKLVAHDADLKSLRSDPRLQRYLPAPRTERPIFDESVEVLYQLNGEHKGNEFGWAGRNAGDCDGDGVNDLVIAAPFYASKESRSPAGRIYVFSGKNGALIFQRTGEAGWRLGMSVEAAGDVNNDGFNDVIVGADGSTREAGRAFVFSGVSGEILHTFSEGTGEDQFGRRVAGAGDLDGDGFDDVVIGAPAHCSTENGNGRIYVYSGKTSELLHTLEGEAIGDGFGGSVCARAVRGQVLMAVGASSAGPQNRGRVYVYELAQSKLRLLSKLDADAQGAQMAETYLSFVGDVDRDGQIDLFTSDWKHRAKGPSTGRAYAFTAATGRVIMTLTGEHRGDTFGAGPGRAGDVDGDGYADLIVGAWRSSEGGLDAGKCTIFSGATSQPLREITCRIPASAFGYDATGMGDLDGDGTVDFLITAAHADFNGKNSGSAFVIKGHHWPTIHADQLPMLRIPAATEQPAGEVPEAPAKGKPEDAKASGDDLPRGEG